MLGFFKYTDFFLDNLNLAFGTHFELLHLALPLAISFFTFQQIAYLCDTYSSKLQGSFLDYCLFVSFFPQLIAGPIVNHKEMLPQFQSLKRFNAENFAKGLFIFSIGLFKKVIIADSFALYANNGFDATLKGVELNFLESWLASLSYTFQLYFDFSGYCDMAIGIALFFNIFLPINFNSPYKALNIQDFWKRWHITLGRFLTQYLYIPLGGSKLGKFKTLRNLFVVFVLSGIWHGAGWGFIIWGLLHAIAMILHRIYHYALEALGLKTPKVFLYKVFCWILTFNFINISWVFFRSENLSSALSILKGMVGGNGVVMPEFLNRFNEITAIKSIFKELQIQFGPPIPTLLEQGSLDFKTLLLLLIGSFATCLLSKPSLNIATKAHHSLKWNFFCSFLLMLALFQIYASDYQPIFLYFNF